jgi:hypothetical protein
VLRNCKISRRYCFIYGATVVREATLIYEYDIVGFNNLAIEIFYFYKETKTVNRINDKYTVKPNILFVIIVNEDADRAL